MDELLKGLLETDKGIGLMIAIGCGIITEAIMRFTPKGFDKDRFAWPISVVAGVAISAIIGPVGAFNTWFRGLVAGAMATAAYGGFRAVLKNYLHIKNGGNGA